MKITRSMRAAVAIGAVGTALVTSTLVGGVANAAYDPCDPKIIVDDTGATLAGGSIIDDCYTPITRPPLNPGGRPTTTTTEATTTTAPRTTTTMGETTTTMGETTTTMGTTSTTMAPPVTGATGARPVAAQASYTG
jgi:hypothetical protein